MPLINKRLLTATIDKHRHEFSTESKDSLHNHLTETLRLIDNKKFESEESEKVAFLMKLFELLGYKHHQNLSFEKSTKYRGSIDGQLTETDKTTQVAIEWKGIDTKDLERGGKAGETPVDQLFRYMSETQAAFGIVGNFLEIRLYSWEKRKDDYLSFELRKLVGDPQALDTFIYLLKPETILKYSAKQSVLKDLIDKTEKDQEEISKRFYQDYKDLRGRLFEHLVQNNSDTDRHLLLEKTQKILDRMIFVMFCEDNQLLPMYTVKNVYDSAINSFVMSETKVWDAFKGLFVGIDKGFPAQNIPAYNGGLFAPDPELDNLVLKDEIFTGFVKLAEYFFDSDLDVNILGHIFEQSISDIEEMKAGLEGETTDKKKSKRKKDGIYYTPSYITEYIVEETVGRWLEEQSVAESPSFQNGDNGEEGSPLRNIKILDPAGGSGAFPNQVHNYLVKKTVEVQTQQAINDGFENFVPDEKTIDKGILKNNIFMVDLQPESVEIAKLSLWLKTARKDQKLNNLDENVRVGNSLTTDWKVFFPRVYNIEGDKVNECIENFINKYITDSGEIDLLRDFAKHVKKILDIYYNKIPPLLNKPDKISNKDYNTLDKNHLLSAILTEIRPFILQGENYINKIKNLICKNSNINSQTKEITKQFQNNFNLELNGSNDYPGWKNTGFDYKYKDEPERFISYYDQFINGEKYHKESKYRVSDELHVNKLSNISFLDKILAHIIRFYINIFALPGFDVVVGNPPYIKEYTNKSAFDGLHDNPYYQGKMDLWTMFACQAIDNLKWGGCLSFIAPNNWISNTGASILRNKILTDGELKTFVDFGDFKVFEDAGIQTMIFVFKKCKPREKYTVDYARVEDKNIGLEKIKLLLSSKLKAEIEGVNKFKAEIEPSKLKGKNLAFVDKKVGEILDKMEAGERWFLDKKEVAQGIVAPQEFVTERHLENSNIEARPNEGIFQLTTQEKENLNFTVQELDYIKPFYTTEQLGRYLANPQNNLWVIYTTNDIKNKIDDLPNIKSHLDRFSEIITSDNKPYGLHRARDEKFFKGKKIVSLRKCTEPTFCFTDFDCYLSQTYYIIKTDKVNLKFLTGVLNSKIVAYWLRYKGKMQGDLYQIDKDPLLNIPIPQATAEQQTQVAELVDRVMDLKKEQKELVTKFIKTVDREYNPKNISKKIEEFWKLDFGEFLTELEKQKVQLSLNKKEELQDYFEDKKTKVLELETQTNQIDEQIEGVVRGLYGVEVENVN
jgi:hypothetical protein